MTSIITKRVTWRKPCGSRRPTRCGFSWCIPPRLFQRRRQPVWICTSAVTRTEAKSVFPGGAPSLPIADAPSPIKQVHGNIRTCEDTPLEESARRCFPFGYSAIRKLSSTRSSERPAPGRHPACPEKRHPPTPHCQKGTKEDCPGSYLFLKRPCVGRRLYKNHAGLTFLNTPLMKQ